MLSNGNTLFFLILNVFTVLWELIQMTNSESGAFKEAFHGLELQLRVAPLSAYLFQSTGIGLQCVQSANGVLQQTKRMTSSDRQTSTIYTAQDTSLDSSCRRDTATCKRHAKHGITVKTCFSLVNSTG